VSTPSALEPNRPLMAARERYRAGPDPTAPARGYPSSTARSEAGGSLNRGIATRPVAVSTLEPLRNHLISSQKQLEGARAAFIHPVGVPSVSIWAVSH